MTEFRERSFMLKELECYIIIYYIIYYILLFIYYLLYIFPWKMRIVAISFTISYERSIITIIFFI